MELLEVASVENRITKRKFPFKIITCLEVTLMNNGTIERKQISGVRTLWSARNVLIEHPKTHLPLNREWQGDALFLTVEAGQLLQGRIENLETTPYTVDGITKDTIACIIWQFESDPIRVAARELLYLQYKAIPLDQTGKPYVYTPTIEEISDDFDYYG